MATEQQLKEALIKAHKAGDTKAAQLFADKIKQMRSQDFGARIDFGGAVDTPKKQEFSLGEKAVGAVEAAKTLGSGLLFGVPAGVIGTAEGVFGDLTGRLTPEQAQQLAAQYSADVTSMPETEAGQRYVKAIGDFLGVLPPVMGAATPLQAMGAGQALGASARVAPAVAKAVPSDIAAAANNLRPQITAEQAQAIKFAEQQRLPLTTTDIFNPTGTVAKTVRNVGENVPVVGTGGIRGAQQDARAGLLDKMKELYPEVTSDELFKSLKESGDKVKAALSNRYEAISQKVGDAVIPRTNTLNAIDKEIKDITAAGVVTDNTLLENLKKLENDIASGEQTFKMFRDNRTFVRENLKSDKPSTQADRAIQRIYNAMTADIQKGVEDVAGKDSAFKLKQADRFLAMDVEAKKNTKLKNVLAKGDVRPELATNMLFAGKNSASDVKQLYLNLDDSGRANARAAIMNRVIAEANESPDRFLSSAKKYQNQFDVFFKGQEKEQLNGLLSYLKATKRAADYAADPKTGNRVIPYVIGGGLATDVATSGGAVSGVLGSIAALSRVYESAPVKSLLIKLSKVKSQDDRKKTVSQLNSEILKQTEAKK